MPSPTPAQRRAHLSAILADIERLEHALGRPRDTLRDDIAAVRNILARIESKLAGDPPLCVISCDP